MDQDFCETQGFMKNLGGLATFLFVLYASTNLMQQIGLFKSDNFYFGRLFIQCISMTFMMEIIYVFIVIFIKIFEYFYNVFVAINKRVSFLNPYVWIWILAIIISSIPFYFNEGYSTMSTIHWCWIKYKPLWIACFYGWIIACWIWLLFAIIKAFLYRNKLDSIYNNDTLKKWFYYVEWTFISCLFIVWSIAVIRRTALIFADQFVFINKDCDGLIHCGLTSIYGIVVGIGYGIMIICKHKFILNKNNTSNNMTNNESKNSDDHNVSDNTSSENVMDNLETPTMSGVSGQLLVSIDQDPDPTICPKFPHLSSNEQLCPGVTTDSHHNKTQSYNCLCLTVDD